MARRHLRVARGPKRDTAWLFIDPSNTTLAAAGGTLVASLNASALALRPFTVVRTHLIAFLHSDQVAATEVYGAGLGMSVVSDQASAIGVTAIPTPITDLGSDLFYVHKLMVGEFTLGDGTGFIESTGDGQQFAIDSKAMRKVNDDQDLVLTLESMVAFTGAGSLCVTAGRFLIKLH